MENNNKEIKPNNQCYSCKHRETIPGDAHSRCSRMIRFGDFRPPKASDYGKSQGWYFFPVNYDPVWQEELCEGFEQNQ